MARKSVRAQWAAKLKGKLSSPTGPEAGAILSLKSFYGTILGIDPSLRGTGLAVLTTESKDTYRLLFSRTVKLKPVLSMPDCLAEIFRAVSEALDKFPVDHVALEQTIYVQNFQTAQILGAARGAAIAAAAIRGLPVFEYPPLRVKQAVVGYGRASKVQVAKTVKSLLGHIETLKLDEADAAGVALCHAITYRIPVEK